jgi:hypothetical protein
VKYLLVRGAGENFVLSWFLWLGLSLVFAAISCASVIFISPQCAGMSNRKLIMWTAMIN